MDSAEAEETWDSLMNNINNHTYLKCKCFFDTLVLLEYLKTMMLVIQTVTSEILEQEGKLLYLVRKNSSDLESPPGSGTILDG